MLNTVEGARCANPIPWLTAKALARREDRRSGLQPLDAGASSCHIDTAFSDCRHDCSSGSRSGGSSSGSSR